MFLKGESDEHTHTTQTQELRMDKSLDAERDFHTCIFCPHLTTSATLVPQPSHIMSVLLETLIIQSDAKSYTEAIFHDITFL